MTKEERKQNFLQKSTKIHNGKYDYSKVDYVDSQTKVCIICPKHGEFWQSPKHHVSGHGCSECGFNNTITSKKLTLDQFVAKANCIHNNYYSYDKVNYINSYTKVIITCPIHGNFEQTPSSHLSGRGCPKCNKSRGEVFVAKVLQNLDLQYIEQYKIPVIDQSFTSKKELEVDFYVPNLNLIIEYNGIQHYIPQEHFGGILKFETYQQPRDQYVQEFCQKNAIHLLTISYKYTDYESINNYIKNYVNKLSIK